MRSFSSLLPYDKVTLKRSRDLPGPTTYNLPNVLSRDIPSSLAVNAVSQRFAQAADRFKTPLNRRVEPVPGAYSPKTEMGQGNCSVFKKNAKAVIGRDT